MVPRAGAGWGLTYQDRPGTELQRRTRRDSLRERMQRKEGKTSA